VDLILNWGVPIVVVLFLIKRTSQISDAAGAPA
jgi:hypothetical protein